MRAFRSPNKELHLRVSCVRSGIDGVFVCITGTLGVAAVHDESSCCEGTVPVLSLSVDVPGLPTYFRKLLCYFNLKNFSCRNNRDEDFTSLHTDTENSVMHY